MKKYQLFNFYFIAVIWINFCISFSFYGSTILSTSYALDVLFASSSIAGFASGIFVIGVMLARLCVEKSLDKINLKKWLIIGLMMMSVFNTLYFYAHNITALNMVRFLHGLTFGLCSSVCGTIVARMIPSFQRGVGIGYYGLSSVVASGIAPFVAIYLVKHNAFNVGFIVLLSLIISAIAFVVMMKVREARGNAMVLEPLASPIKQKILSFIEPSALKISLIGFLVAFCFGSLVSFIGAFAKNRDLIEAGSVFFLIYAITSFIMRPISGKIFDLKGHNAVILPSLCFFVLSFLCIAFARNSFMLMLGAVFCGLGYGNFVSAAQSYAIKIAPKNKLGLATATYYMMMDFGAGVGPFFLGLAIGIYGYNVSFVLCAFMILIALMLYIKLIFKQ